MYMDKRKLDKKKTDTICIVKKQICWGCSSFVASRQLSSGPVPQKGLILE